MQKQVNPIFFDQTQKRTKIIRLIIILGITIFSVFLSIFLLSVFLHPVLPIPKNITNIYPNNHLRPGNEKGFLKNHDHKYHGLGHSQMLISTGSVSSLPTSQRKVYGFGVEWDDTSFASLQDHLGQMDTVIMEELTLSGSSIQVLNKNKWERTLNFIRSSEKHPQVVPLINNFNQEKNIWDGKGLSATLKDTQRRSQLVNAITGFVSQYHLGGINIDFEEIDEPGFQDYLLFLDDLGFQIHQMGGELSVNVPMANDTFNFEEISKRVDMVFLMAYDEHWATAMPGPIASLDWFTDGIKNALLSIPKEKLSVIIGNYGYDWIDGTKESVSRTFQEVHTLMRESEENISFDTGSMNPMFSYIDDDNKNHEVWYLDAITAYNQLKILDVLGVQSIGLWRLGSEDPSFWNIDTSRLTPESFSGLTHFSYGYDIDYEGTGEFYQIQNTPTMGTRSVVTNSGMIVDESIQDFPLPYTIGRHGGLTGKKVVLSFDDGPDPDTTPKILDILRDEKVPALFFVIGESAQTNPFLIKRIYNEGHTLGNHSYSHPDISRIGDMRMNLELTSTERIIESILHHKTILFRPPYGEDIEPETPNQVMPLESSHDLGYLTVGMRIDPNDWANPGTDEIVRKTLEQAESGKGNIILLHDGGGDRKQTIEALPRIIHTLRNQGYEFVAVNDLLHESREDLMPQVSQDESFMIMSDSITFWVMRVISGIIFYTFLIALIFGIFRGITIVVFALVEKLHMTPKRSYGPLEESISTTVIVPAYNESKVICKTIESLLQSNYKNFDIIIIDDGSTDGTQEKVQKIYGKNPRVSFIRKENSGKGNSMNFGINHTKSEVIIVIDADTLFTPDTIGLLIRHFHDPSVGAVSGNVKVGNRVNFLTRLQAIEYITSQNIDKRAYNALGVITVVPGAVGAWRRNVVVGLGGFPLDTLAEDSDMTFAILRAGYTVEHEEYAYAYTEAPEDMKSFIKQRFRWTFGILQVTRKHSDIFLQRNSPPMLRYFILPSFVISQVVVPLIAPIFDFMILLSIVLNWINYILYGSLWYLQSIYHILMYIIVFIVIDFIIGIIAVFFEKDEEKSILFYLLPQRLFYRFFMYLMSLRSLWHALHGNMVGWGKLDRTNSAKIMK